MPGQQMQAMTALLAAAASTTKHCTFVAELPVLGVLQAEEVVTAPVAFTAHGISHTAEGCTAYKNKGASVQAR